MILGLNFSYAQELCEQCDSCEEEGGEGADDADFSADIGREGGEMNITEADMMGTEVGEEAGTELVVEIDTEFLASAALDAIQGVGEVVMVALAIATHKENSTTSNLCCRRPG